MVSLLDWQLDIYERVRGGLPNTPIYLEGIPEASRVEREPTGFYRPTVILWFGQAVDPAGFGGRLSIVDLCGRAGDNVTKQATFLAQAVAPTGLALLELAQAVRDLLAGYAPAGMGQLSEAGTGTVRDPFPLGIGDTLRFYVAIGFRGTVTVGPHTKSLL